MTHSKNILDGRLVSSGIYQELQERISQISEIPTLGAVLVGEDNSPSLRYIEQKRKACKKVGMEFKLFHFGEDISQDELIAELENINNNQDVSAYIVQLPLPGHIDSNTIIESIDPLKDADGFHPVNQGKVMIGDKSGFAPCTPAGIMKLIEYYKIDLNGKKVCILGKSNIVGKPLTMLMINAGATVSTCNSRTPDISRYTRDSDIVVCATGRAGLLTGNMLDNKTIIIDVGFSVIDGVIHGDADTQSLLEAGHMVTPVPGGVGPMTVAMLLSNTLRAHESK